MMNNLFNIFDPASFMFNLNWSSSIIIILILPMKFWTMQSRSNSIYNSLNNWISKEMKINIKKNNSIIIISSLFIFISMNNFMGLFPYTFTSTSHLTMTLTFSLPIWLSIMMYGWTNMTNKMFTHLIPNSTPTILMPFMTIIETISNIIRPVTLAVRLTANMIAGHLILTIMSSNNPEFKFIPIILISEMMMMILEMAVAMIQAYVFTILSSLYLSEIN
uniref:ATP synthase subunit a n=1 Tax=Pseudoneureclipsis sibuyana TaxID=2904893 RepID=A0A9E8LQJ6_9NEOP|nr:ATP synthase F0 subunit 6 [Pseudoneureclipsis sibuyana]UZZ44290.1 ATP synthase F0 subunit 6 [Pseudoneureclipsis sibuyana]